VLYGYIDKWDRSYYGLQSVNTVQVRVKMVSANSDLVLFESLGSDSTSRGITKIPTGFSSLVVEPLKGLDYEIISELASSVVSEMLSPLKASVRPDFLETPPPVIYAVGARVHNDTVHIVLFGSAKHQASLSIAGGPSNVPMIERSSGHYYGEYLPIKVSTLASKPDIKITLGDSFGRKTEQLVVNWYE
jgi:hypothetical protein